MRRLSQLPATLLLIPAATATLGWITPANAQDTGDTTAPETTATDDDAPAFRLPPVVVTARKIEELTRDVPLSVTVIPESTIEDAGFRTIEDAARLVPNLNMVEFTARRLSFPFIRGIGSGQGEPAVTTYIDGVPQLSVASTNRRLLDVERIEFLRGPQGTLYGRNAIGGVIHVVTRKPTNTPELRLGATFGDYDLQEYSASLSLPLIEDNLYLGLSGLVLKRDGYTRNDFTGRDVDDRDSLYGRGQLVWTPDDRNEFRLILANEETRDGGFTLSDLDMLRDRPHRINQDFEGVTNRDVLSSSLTWSHEGDAIDLTSITGFVDWSILETTDFDFSVLDGVRRTTEEDQRHLSQEIRIASSADAPVELNERATLSWQLGALAFEAESFRSAANEFRPAGAGILFPPASVGTSRAEGDFDDWAVGVFGEATLTFDDRLDLTAGLRYDYERKDAAIDNTFMTGGFTFPTGSVRDEESYDELVPRFSAAYRWSEQVMTYGTIARGWKAGGFNLTAPVGNASFDTETSWTYEVGFKTNWLDDRLTFNAAGFYIEWDDMQLSQFDPTTGGYVTNAGDSTSLGFELELGARVAEGLDLFGSFGYLETEFDEFADSFGNDTSGNDLPFAPETTLNVGAQYTMPLSGGRRLYVRGDYTNVGQFYYDAGNIEGERYDLATFRVGVGGHSWRVEGWIRNAFDEEYVPVAIQPSPVDPTAFVGRSGDPQTVGVTVSLTF